MKNSESKKNHQPEHLTRNQKMAKITLVFIFVVLVIFALIYVFQKSEIDENSVETNIGYIKKVYEKEGKHYLVIDYIQWLQGEDAKKAALADGQCQKLEECAPNGFYILNNENDLRTFEIGNDAQIIMQTFSHGDDGNFRANETITYDQFKNLFTTSSPFLSAPFSIDIKGGSAGKIMGIREKYVP